MPARTPWPRDKTPNGRKKGVGERSKRAAAREPTSDVGKTGIEEQQQMMKMQQNNYREFGEWEGIWRTSQDAGQRLVDGLGQVEIWRWGYIIK